MFYVCSRDGSVEFRTFDRTGNAEPYAKHVAKRKGILEGDVTVVVAGDPVEAADKAARYFKHN